MGYTADEMLQQCHYLARKETWKCKFGHVDHLIILDFHFSYMQ